MTSNSPCVFQYTALTPLLLNAAMQIERQKHLGAAPHERTEQRNGHANGFKDKKTLHTRLGQTGAVAQTLCAEGLALCRAVGDTHGLTLSLSVLVMAAAERGNYARTHSLCAELSAIAGEIQDAQTMVGALAVLGQVAVARYSPSQFGRAEFRGGLGRRPSDEFRTGRRLRAS